MRAGVLTEAITFIGKELADHGKQLDVLESCFCPRDWKRFEALDVDVGEVGYLERGSLTRGLKDDGKHIHGVAGLS